VAIAAGYVGHRYGRNTAGGPYKYGRNTYVRVEEEEEDDHAGAMEA
jgi:hypothetical protein